MTSLDLKPEPWRVINDSVMGGVSLGEIVVIDNGLRFQGKLSLENNGGFASVHRPFNSRLENVGGIRLRVHGDGRPYQFRVRVDDNYDGISWRHAFDTDGFWRTVELLFDDFEPVFRGRKISGVDSLDISRIRQLGLLLADGRAGAFRLDIAVIDFVYR
jgi:monofunctional biosynthetic peptidoglycan transglycosylase